MKKLLATGVIIDFAVICIVLPACSGEKAWAVTSKITYHRTAEELLKGKAEGVIIGSKGTLQLGRKWEKLAGDFNDVWSVNSIVLSGGKVYLGTSPNGGIYRYSLGSVEEIYSAKRQKAGPAAKQAEKDDPNDSNDLKDANDSNDLKDANDSNDKGVVIKSGWELANEHIFAMATDISGRLLAGVSGRRCALCRLEKNELRTIFEPNDAKYIFAIEVAKDGRIFLGTGPEGKIYELDSAAKDAKVVYDSSDKNILSLAVANDGSLLAGTDTRGLVYKIDPQTGSAAVLYDSDQQEVTGLLVSPEGEIYATATSAQVVAAQKQFARQVPLAGRPEESGGAEDGDEADKKPLQLKIANTSKNEQEQGKEERPSRKGPKSEQVSHLYKISAEGFVTDVFAEAAVLYALGQQGSQLLLGTGNEAELYTVEPVSEVSAVIYKDQQASQITAVAVSGDEVYIGTANPAKLIRIGAVFASEGTYTSDLVDASQPADWGKLQIEADVPADCNVMAASRSGNVKDVNDPTLSDWTEAAQIKGPVQLGCPLGRYCQYKLILSSTDGLHSPVVREVAVASTIPNLPPNVQEVTAERIAKPDKQGYFEIKYTAQDDNGDTLIYRIDFRKVGRQGWIELAKDVEQPSYEWDGRTAEDGRYEIRVTGSDERSNSAAQKMTASRVSDPVVVDNTGPAIEILSVGSAVEATLTAPAEIRGQRAVIQMVLTDQLSAIGELGYTVDSSSEWKAAVPEDLVYDTTEERFTLVVEELKDGEHVVSVRAKDSLGNTTYRTVELNVKAE